MHQLLNAKKHPTANEQIFPKGGGEVHLKVLLMLLSLCLQDDQVFQHLCLRIIYLNTQTRPRNMAVNQDKLIGCCGTVRTQRAWLSTNRVGLVWTACVSTVMTVLTCL